MTEQSKAGRGLPGFIVAGVLVLVLGGIGVAAFRMFGPQPEPHARYNSAELIRKGMKDPSSLTPDERRVFDHITHSMGGGPKSAPHARP